jgi:hypothetical protein
MCYNIGTEQEKGSKRKNEVVKVKILKNILNWFVFLLTGKGKLADEMVDEGLIDYSGQGRDKYGK